MPRAGRKVWVRHISAMRRSEFDYRRTPSDAAKLPGVRSLDGSLPVPIYQNSES